MVYDTYNYSIHGFINQQTSHLGAPHCWYGLLYSYDIMIIPLYSYFRWLNTINNIPTFTSHLAPHCTSTHSKSPHPRRAVDHLLSAKACHPLPVDLAMGVQHRSSTWARYAATAPRFPWGFWWSVQGKKVKQKGYMWVRKTKISELDF